MKRPERRVVRGRAMIVAPQPEAVEVRQHPFFDALPVARRFGQTVPAQAGPRHWKYATHAAVRFAQPVAGPVIAGAGRYHGLGLMVPFEGEMDPFMAFQGPVIHA